MDFLVGEKRKGDGEGLDVKEVKRVKGNVKKVAEMVLVLSGLGKMRGGRFPSEAERGLMEEAREKLVEVCQEFAPKDVFPVDGIGGLLEDLGVGDCKEERLGFRKMSISEKLVFSKRKFQMEDAEEFALPPPTSSQKFRGPGRPANNALERRGLPQQVQVNPQVKSFQISIPPANLQPAGAPFSHVAGTNSTPVPYQLPIGEVRPTISNALPSSHLVKDSPALPPARIDHPSLEVNGRPTSSSHASQVQVQAHSSTNQTAMRTTTRPLQPQPVSSTHNNVPVQSHNIDANMGIRSVVTPQSTVTKPVTPQVATGASNRNVGQPSRMRNTHAEIANMVQKLLQRYVEPPVWNPPSRDYLSRPWPCQMCQSPVTDAVSLLICDHCEKGYHLKCLQTANHKKNDKGEWHCFRCLSASHGKPIPPKYGRVMRNTNNNKIILTATSTRPAPHRKTATVDEKHNLQEVSSNGINSVQSGASASTGNNDVQPILQSTSQNASAMQKNEIVSRKGELDGKHSPGTCLNNSTGDHVVVSRQPEEENRLVDVKSNSVADSEKVNEGSHSQQLDQQSNVKEGLDNHSVQSADNHITVTYSSEHCGSEAASQPNKEPNEEEIEVLRVNHVETTKTTTSSDRETSNSSVDLSDVWVGTMLKVADEKVYYNSCRINGVVYKIHDYVLVRFENGKLIPSKLQVMWEDCQTKSKWFTVNSCYFPSDLPEAIGRPCGLESNEVYESTRESTIMSSSIQGPCDVLPQNKFEAEKERRASSRIEEEVGLRPYYLCRWIYDEAKGSFREVSY